MSKVKRSWALGNALTVGLQEVGAARIAVGQDQVDLAVGVHIEQVDVGVLVDAGVDADPVVDVVVGRLGAAAVAVGPDLDAEAGLHRVDDDALGRDLRGSRSAAERGSHQGAAQGERSDHGGDQVLLHARILHRDTDRHLNSGASV